MVLRIFPMCLMLTGAYLHQKLNFCMFFLLLLLISSGPEFERVIHSGMSNSLRNEGIKVLTQS